MEVAEAFIIFVINYHLTDVLCPVSWLNKLKQLLFRFLWLCKGPLVKCSVCCYIPLKGGIGMPRLLIRKLALTPWHLWFYLDGEKVEVSVCHMATS